MNYSHLWYCHFCTWFSVDWLIYIFSFAPPSCFRSLWRNGWSF